ncbi:c-type cytochrome [Collimonas sp. OK607]|uniref:c-type cytochrome n=1 Tax=Collimonas sp. OK607 TaxID=1798194 RepID=UPI0011138159|nr:c-type cytochrome [Collimonas sp. OK607]
MQSEEARFKFGIPCLHKLIRRSRFLVFLAVALFAGTAHTAEVDAGTVPDTIKQRLTACTACHGEQGRATNDGYYPRIAGKPAGYLYNQLHNFREGRRRYPMMTYLVDHLSDTYLQEIAQYFADQHPPYPAPQPFDQSSATRERGEILVNKGDPGKKILACIACHGSAMTGVMPATPGLLGLPRDYLVGQIGAWKNGARHAKAPDCMAQVVQRLSAEDIGAVSAWLAAQPVPADAVAVAPTSVKLPLACGSVPN